ncbi:MAG: OmpA/MotB family protein [Pseudomonadota bacterium]
MTQDKTESTEPLPPEKPHPPPYDRRALISSPASSTWLISFTDVIALLLTFFVMIFSMINPERSIMGQIGFSLHDKESYVGDASVGARDAKAVQRREAVAGKDLAYLAAVLKRNLRNYPALAEAKITENDHFLTIELPQSLLFNAGGFTVRQNVRTPLAEVFNLLGSLRNRIEIYGYSDPSPVRGAYEDFKSNWGLSQQRAASVAAMVYESGYRQSVALYGLGIDKDALDAPDMTAEQRAPLRRVEIRIHENRSGLF